MFTSLKIFILAKKKIFIPVSVVLILILALFSFRTVNKKGPILPFEKWDKLVLDQKYTPSYILSPSQSSKYGIVSHEIFTLKTKDPQDVSIIQNNLVSSKPVKVTKTSETEFKVVPANDLNIGETISFSMKNDKDYSWAFQTAPKFNVVQSLPTNKAKSVPINAGIEITFNNDNYNLKNSDVEIQPKIDFRIEKHDEKASIVPLNPLQPMTAYSVTIKKGFSLFSSNNAISEDYSFSFQTSDENTNKGRISLAKDFQEIFPDEHLITKVYANNFDSNQVINAQVYKFSSADNFLSSRANLDKINSSWMQYYGEQDMVDTKSLAKVATVDVKLQEKDNLQYLELPQNLDEGMYLVQFWFDGYKKVEQLWVQSSSIAGYVSVGKLQTVVWINSSKNVQLGSSTISVIGTGDTYSTNNEGWAAFPTSASLFDGNIKHYLSVTTSGGRNLILPVDSLTNNAKPNDIVA
ncbi:MAG: Ig-like domain-containing protein, partial [Candidatus Woesebacteria bacterium]|nr:Ig-like domain-containing protein [Candidatus Woesebacteria bacterium]